jgi:hypothetical protein
MSFIPCLKIRVAFPGRWIFNGVNPAIVLFSLLHSVCLIRDRNCLAFGSTCGHPQFLVVWVLLSFLVFCVVVFICLRTMFCVSCVTMLSLDCPFLIAYSVFFNVYSTDSKIYDIRGNNQKIIKFENKLYDCNLVITLLNTGTTFRRKYLCWNNLFVDFIIRYFSFEKWWCALIRFYPILFTEL